MLAGATEHDVAVPAIRLQCLIDGVRLRRVERSQRLAVVCGDLGRVHRVAEIGAFEFIERRFPLMRNREEDALHHVVGVSGVERIALSGAIGAPLVEPQLMADESPPPEHLDGADPVLETRHEHVRAIGEVDDAAIHPCTRRRDRSVESTIAAIAACRAARPRRRPPSECIEVPASRHFKAWLATTPEASSRPDPTDPHLPVLVVGAGPAGLAAMSALARRGIAFEAIEQHDAVGGIWDDANPVSSVYEGMRTAASRATSQLFRPMPRDWPLFVPFERVRQYLNESAAEEGVLERIHFGTRFEGAERSRDGTWVAALRTGVDIDRRPYRAIVFATGSHNRDHARFDEPLRASAVAAGLRVLHSADYHRAADFARRRVLVVGAGASATDIAGKLAGTTARIILAVRDSPWIIPASVLRTVPLLARLGIAPDRLASDTRWLPNGIRDAVFGAVVRAASGNNERYGLSPPKHGLFDRVPVLDRGILKGIRSGHVVVRPAVTSFDNGAARFADSQMETVDDVIFATGYTRHYPLLGRTGNDVAAALPAFGLFHPNEPGLAYMTEMVGAGSCWPIFVEQGRAIAAYLAAEQRDPEKAEAFNARRTTAPPSFKGALFSQADAFHIDYGLYTRALRDLVAWLDD